MNFTFNAYYTLIAAVIVLLIGKFLVNRIEFLRKYNIPEPVAGGLVAATISTLVYNFWGHTIISFVTSVINFISLLSNLKKELKF